MKVLVCGGRDFGSVPNKVGIPEELLAERRLQQDFVNDKLDELFNFELPECVIEGGATGADTCAMWWATTNGVPVKTYAAEWDKHGKSAGSIRNQRMLFEAKPDLVIAFPGGDGTADMVAKAKRGGVEVITITMKEYEDEYARSLRRLKHAADNS